MTRTPGPRRDWRVDMRADFAGSAPMEVDPPTPNGRWQFELTAGRIDQDAEDFFGRGYCHWLAGAIHSMTGWELATVDSSGPDGWEPAHTAVVTPNGSLLDIFGERTADVVRADHNQGGRVETRVRDVSSVHMPGDVITGIDDLRGDPLWWANMFGDDDSRSVLLHYARLVLRQNGYGEDIAESALESTATSVDPAPSHHPSTSTAPSTTTSPGTGGGATMSSIEEIRAFLFGSNEKATGLQGLLAQAAAEAQDVTAGIQTAAQGSANPAIQEAVSIYAQITAAVEQAIGMVTVARDTLGSYAATL
ncbi:hypothetical protein GCM10022222_42590 [Amycolatopsis ultiminotia]|uniref:Uncharacterized protein n=1 Tax=Amycolatopsis ultiminotia TaxID=543629 RepID=A0ABP6WRL6_9PSEU